MTTKITKMIPKLGRKNEDNQEVCNNPIKLQVDY